MAHDNWFNNTHLGPIMYVCKFCTDYLYEIIVERKINRLGSSAVPATVAIKT